MVERGCVGSKDCKEARTDELHVFDTTKAIQRVIVIKKRQAVNEKHTAMRALYSLMLRVLR
jgi:hypothetical protein